MFEKKKGYKDLIPEFDSSSSMLFALGNYLFGKDEAVGLPPKLPAFLGDLVNSTPRALRKSAFKIGGAQEAISLRALKKLTDTTISQWIIDAYPRKKFPAVFIGSSNGALIHMCSMVEGPWIPQTILIALSRTMDPDELLKDAAWGKKAAGIMEKTLPYFRHHQMHDPVQDRIMVAAMAYFRLKRLKIGPRLEDYLRRTLVPGGEIIISDCRYRWPSYHIAGEHYFQTGGLGDVGGYEYARGSPRISAFLRRQRSLKRRWEVPGPLADIPEAEWGFAPELKEDIKRFACRWGYKVRSLSYDHPQDLSPLAADMTRMWYEKNNMPTQRLLIECFALLEPYIAAQTASIPYWLAFNTGGSYNALETYVNGLTSIREIYAMVMSNAVEGIGCVPISRWRRLLKKASLEGHFVGIDEEEYPYDLGSFIKYYQDLKKKIKARYFMPYRLSLAEFYAYIRQNARKYRVRLEDVR